MAPLKILLLEDDPPLRQAVAGLLEEAGYRVTCAEDVYEAEGYALSELFDLYLVDVVLPDVDGFTFLRRLRERGDQTPAIFLTARDQVEDRVRGLSVAGGDDYVVKPFSSEELLARIAAVLRRSGKVDPHGTLSVGPIRFDPAQGRVVVRGTPIELTPTEERLLLTFLRHPGEVLPRERLLASVWGDEGEVDERSLELYIHYLRRKLRPFGLERAIETVRGRGYRLLRWEEEDRPL
ncbi:response regulator transcription factor [Brockia lithotrophica]|uniref:Two-component system OmpR family response regulator n=1 Tax=Brockia lithotrophica TaxID=933949 RepID=A0A660LAE4_9BACL|nr:response regulator transcription factor [Brockia lithotrophica]RKQ88943.1 two-component system OmpR family response regulator [Brockia lithotrophica]